MSRSRQAFVKHYHSLRPNRPQAKEGEDEDRGQQIMSSALFGWREKNARLKSHHKIVFSKTFLAFK